MMTKIQAKVIPGYGAASGKNQDQRYPKGTISVQAAFFEERGLDLSSFFKGTLNIDISPYTFEIKKPKHFFEQVDWSEHIPPENFYFFDISLFHKGTSYEGLIYMPDPKTKTEHVQQTTTLELVLPKVAGLEYGQEVSVGIDQGQLQLNKRN
ncbi:hypothetical protein WIW50_10865 [Flavobacteriaceae bacterium 3-367]|uniref:hypothetical protein n=1 Tax=Eudoraea algarum TaxID=3417568 RepID=UPI003271F094